MKAESNKNCIGSCMNVHENKETQRQPGQDSIFVLKFVLKFLMIKNFIYE